MKNGLRTFAKKIRHTLDINSLSQKVQQNLLSLPEYKSASNIFCYYSFSDEVITRNLFDNKIKNWYMPKITGDNMCVCPYCSDKLVQNQYKILESETNPIEDTNILDMIIIPALAADKNGYRIGYGKGYYDRFLKSLTSNPVRVVLLFSDLLFDDVCPDSFDEKCDIIITDKEIYRINVKK